MPELANVRFKENYMVTVHRRFTEAIFDTPLSIYEQRIFYAALSNIEPPTFKQDENNELIFDENGNKVITNYLSEFPIFEMRLKEFGDLIGLKEIDYRHIKKIMRDFKKKGLEIHRLDRPEHEINEKDYRGINFLLDSEYLHNEGIIRLEFSPKLLPYVANLTGEFVTVPLNVITSFSSKYSTKLFFQMKQWQKIKKKDFELDELKGIMGVPFETKNQAGKTTKVFKLSTLHNFRTRALEPAINEINKFSKLNVQYQEIKRGKKVTGLRFIIGTKTFESDNVPNSIIEPNVNSFTVQEYLAKEAFDSFNYGTMFFKNIVKSLNNISDLDTDRELELKIYSGLQSLKEYYRSNSNLSEGYLISETRKMVDSYNTNSDFSFKNSFIRTEKSPEWFNSIESVKKSRLEFEQKQSYTVLRSESLLEPEVEDLNTPEAPSKANNDKIEEEKQALLQKLKLKKEKINKKAKSGQEN